MDAPGAYRGGTYNQHISPRELARMKKNMKKVPVIQLKSDIYHNHESHEAENILGNISSSPIETPVKSTPIQTTHHGILGKIYSLRHRFISLF